MKCKWNTDGICLKDWFEGQKCVGEGICEYAEYEKIKFGYLREYSDSTYLIPEDSVELFDDDVTVLFRKEDGVDNTGDIMLYESLKEEMYYLEDDFSRKWEEFRVEDQFYELRVELPIIKDCEYE